MWLISSRRLSAWMLTHTSSLPHLFLLIRLLNCGESGVGKSFAVVLSCPQAEAFFLTLSNEFQTLSSLQTFQQSLTHHIGGLEHLQPDRTRSPTQSSLSNL